MENLIKEFLEHADKEHLDKDLYYWLHTNSTLREKIYREVEKEYHREDVKSMAEELGHEVDDDELEELVAYYEDYLGNDDGWWYACREAFCQLFDDVEDDDEF